MAVFENLEVARRDVLLVDRAMLEALLTSPNVIKPLSLLRASTISMLLTVFSRSFPTSVPLLLVE